LWYQQSLKHILLFYFLLPSLPFLHVPFPFSLIERVWKENK
jgi:hypothetical protein